MSNEIDWQAAEKGVLDYISELYETLQGRATIRITGDSLSHDWDEAFTPETVKELLDSYTGERIAPFLFKTYWSVLTDRIWAIANAMSEDATVVDEIIEGLGEYLDEIKNDRLGELLVVEQEWTAAGF